MSALDKLRKIREESIGLYTHIIEYETPRGDRWLVASGSSSASAVRLDARGDRIESSRMTAPYPYHLHSAILAQEEEIDHV